MSAATTVRYDARALPVVPWKNGGGTTREILCCPAGATIDEFEWRVSIATIVADGAFSAFPGVDRNITLLHGGGVHLSAVEGNAVDHCLDVPFSPFAFDGGHALHATVRAGESLDFNVMTRRGRLRSTVRVLHDAAVLQPHARGLLHVAARGWVLEGGAGIDGRLDALHTNTKTRGKGVGRARRVPRGNRTGRGSMSWR